MAFYLKKTNWQGNYLGFTKAFYFYFEGDNKKGTMPYEHRTDIGLVS